VLEKSAIPFHEIIEILVDEYEEEGWWPHESRFEIMLGAILVQRTKWANVEKALDSLKKITSLDPRSILSLERHDLENAIRPSGFFMQKSERILSLSSLLSERFNSDSKKLFDLGVGSAREILMDLNGIGPETADTMLLYAGDKPVFIIDSYALRIYKRVSGSRSIPSIKHMQKCFIGPRKITAGLSRHIHSAVVTHCQRTCKTRPSCTSCMINRYCEEAKK